MVELLFATVGKLTVLTIGLAVGLTFAPAANANPGDLSFAQFLGPNVAPIPQQPSSSCDPTTRVPAFRWPVMSTARAVAVTVRPMFQVL
jgi:hypothetical protein